MGFVYADIDSITSQKRFLSSLEKRKFRNDDMENFRLKTIAALKKTNLRRGEVEMYDF